MDFTHDETSSVKFEFFVTGLDSSAVFFSASMGND